MPADALKIPFSLTRLTARRGNASKRLATDLDGRPTRDPLHTLGIIDGTMEHLQVPGLEGLATLLTQHISPKHALVHGVVLGSVPGDLHQLVLSGKQGAPGTAARSLECFDYPPGPRLIMFDVDPEEFNPTRLTSPHDLLERLSAIWPPFTEAGWLATCSTSSAIRDKVSGEWLRPPGGMHVYLIVTGDVARFRELARKCLWLAGYGYVRFAKPNAHTGVAAILQRAIIDLSVFSPERLDYVAGALIEKKLPFYQDRPAPELHEGMVLDLDALPDVTAEEEVEYTALVTAAHAALLPQQRAMVHDAVRQAMPEADEQAIDAEVLTRLARAEGGLLAPDHPLYFANGHQCTAGEATKKLDRLRLADPGEPEYGLSQATFFWNQGGTSWRISSWSHGVQKTYTPLVPDKPVQTNTDMEHGTTPLRERFRVDKRGVWFHPPFDKEGNQPADVWVCAPLHIVAATRDEQNDNHGHLLEFRDRHGHPQQWAMPLFLLEDTREYRKVLRRLGLEMNNGAWKALQMYLDVCHAATRARCVDRVGWHDTAYVLPDAIIGDHSAERLVLQTLDHKSEGYHQAGTLDGWRTEISARCVGNSRLVFTASAGFAAPVLRLLNEESSGLHLRGASSEGKTTALIVAATAWGEPGRLERWRATANALEGVALAHNDNLLCLDELREIDPREAGGVAYMLANGAGKRRGQPHGGTRPRLTWRLLFVSTGEMSLEQHMAEAGQRSYAGQEVRLVDIPADAGAGFGLFENLHGAASSKDFADQLREATHRHYGHAGRAFVAALGQNIPGNTATIQQLRDGFVTQQVPSGASGQVYRVASRFGLIGAAGELATAAGLTGWPDGTAVQAAARCFGDWLQYRGGIGNAEEARALGQVRLFFERYGEARFKPWTLGDGETCERCRGSGRVDYSYKHGTCFDCGGTGKVSSESEPNRPIYDRAGFRRATADGRTEFYALPEVFRHEITKGLDTPWVARVLMTHGLLHPDPAGKSQRSERLPGMGTQRVYRFTPDILGAAESVASAQKHDSSSK